MRIGIYFDDLCFSDSRTGGSFTFQQCIFNALKNLKDNKHEFYIFSTDKIDFPKNSFLKFIYLKKIDYPIKDSFFKKVKRKFFKKKENIFNNKEDLNNAAFENNIELMWFPTNSYKFVEIPFFYTVWDLQHRLQSYFPEVSVSGCKFEDREKKYSYIIPRASYIFIGNQAGKQEVVKFYNFPKERVKILPLPTPDFLFNYFETKNDFINKLGIKRNYLFYPAQFWPHKNHILILLAIKILKEKYGIDFDVVFTGSDKGNLNYIKEKVEELGLKEKVYFLGFVSIENLIELYRNAFALVFPSFFGPDNIPPLEAFALKCPVIAAKVSGAEYQLGDAAILFDPKSENELVSAIKKLQDDVILRSIIIEKGFNKSKSWKAEDYVCEVLRLVDEFSEIRRCWSNKQKYIHL
ncbi:glycosyltransferase family 4 protein [Candidatus Babeliales bacterium]|nr:glycosyltransferase family 4 protein [Candidatus Babeliales bacterium]